MAGPTIYGRLRTRDFWEAFIYSRRNIFLFSFWSLTWDGNPGLTSNKSTHYQLNYGDLKNISTFIHNWSLKSFNQNYDLAPHTAYVVCVNFIRDLQFNVDSERQLFEKLFRDNFLYSRRNIFLLTFWCLIWDAKPGLSSNKPTHYQLDYGDFKKFSTQSKLGIFALLRELATNQILN